MNILEQIPEAIRETLIRILLALLALVAIWLLRRIVGRLVIAPLRRLTQRSQTPWDEYVLEASILPGNVIVTAIAIFICGRILFPDIASREFIDHLFRSLFIVAIFLVVFRAITLITATSIRLERVTGLHVEDALLPFLRIGVKIALVATLVVIVIAEWGYDVSALIAGLGLGGLAISLAAQDTIANIFSFSAIVGDRPFVVGEYIKTVDVEGTVEYVGLRSTRIRQQDQALVTVPNTMLVASAILNLSHLTKRWMNITLRLTHEATAAQIQALVEQLRTMLTGREHVEPDSVVVFFTSIGDQALEVLVRCYITLPDWAEFSHEKEAINLDIMQIIEDLGLQIAVPNRPVYITARLPESHNEESIEP